MAEFGICPQAQSSKKIFLSFFPFSQLSLYQPYVVQHLNVTWDKTAASENELRACWFDFCFSIMGESFANDKVMLNTVHVK